MTASTRGAAAQTNAAPATRPNIVFVLADDLGWLDTSTYGSTFYQTPNVARLAARGMTFSRAYSASPLCSPTRASILTGQYPGRLRITAPSGHETAVRIDVAMPKSAATNSKVVTAPSRTRLPLECDTLGQAMKRAGYRTAFMGKWHLGREPYVPQNFGFDVVVGGGPHPGPPSYFSPYKMGHYLADGPPGEHIDDRLSAEAARFIKANRDRPFFLNLSTYDVHAPFQAKPEYIEKYRRLADARNGQHSPTYAAMVNSTDDVVGRVLNTLDRLKLTGNTFFVFFSDNGGNMYDRIDGTTPTDNAPLRNGKGSIWEGGTRVPLIVAWPDHIRPGAKNDTPISSIDFYPTLLRITGASGKAGQVVDGVDLTSVWEETGVLNRDTIFCHFPHTVPATSTPASVYVHQRNWKLIRFFADNADQTDRFELYDLAADIGETNDLSARNPDKVRALNALITQHLKDTGALVPFANPNYRPSVEIDGWQNGGDAVLKRGEGTLQVVSGGGDPFFSVGDLPKAAAPYVVKFRLRTEIDGDGFAFWSTRAAKGFGAARRVPFAIQRDGAWHDYAVTLPAEDAITNLRLDPGTATGVADFDWIRLLDKNGATVRAWKFDAK